MNRGQNHKHWGIRLGIVIWLVLETLTPGIAAYGDEAWMASGRHYRAVEIAENCVIFRSLSRRTNETLKTHQKSLTKQIELVKKEREKLEACAREKGLVSIVSDNDEVKMAELCSADYASWIHLNYQMEVTRRDIAVASDSKQWLDRQLTFYCPKLPEPRKAQEVQAEKAPEVTAAVSVLSAFAVSE